MEPILNNNFRGFMKNVFVAIVLSSLCNWAFASNEPVPGSINIAALSVDIKLSIKRNNLNFIRERLGPHIILDHPTRGKVPDLEVGMLLPLFGLPMQTEDGHIVFTFLDSVHDVVYFEIEPNAKIRTVFDLYADVYPKYKNSFKFVYDADPYEGMSDDVKQDLMMSKILAAIKSGNYKDALPEFERMEKLQKDLPESFYYYYIVALDGAGRTTSVQSRGRTFLKKYGTDSNYYQKVIAIMSK
jgi:hypothetical protein